MVKRIAIIQGHPDAERLHLGHALADAYADGARAAGHLVRDLMVAQLDIPMLMSKRDWEHGAVPECVQAAQSVIHWADHLVIVHPLWLGSEPALLKAFFEQVFRPGFAVQAQGRGWKKCLAGRSARVVVTMSVSTVLRRCYLFSPGLQCLVRDILKFSGVAPVRSTLIGGVEAGDGSVAARWLPAMGRYGAAAI